MAIKEIKDMKCLPRNYKPSKVGDISSEEIDPSFTVRTHMFGNPETADEKSCIDFPGIPMDLESEEFMMEQF